MEEVDKLYNKLKQIEALYGIVGVTTCILLIVGFALIWKYLISTVQNQAKITFDKELADHNKGIQRELARLNTELNFLKEKQIGNIDKEREAILEYLSAYSKWLFGSLEVDILSYKYNNFEDINAVLKEMRIAQSTCNQSWNKLKFWSTDNELLIASHNLNLELLKYSQYHEKILSELRYNLSWGKSYSDKFVSGLDKFEQFKEMMHFLASEEKKIKEENDAIVKNFWKNKLPIYQEVILKNDAFQKQARKYLKHE